ncbi:MAG: TonB-dependent receptor [Candidatus Auribacterota bacterium]|jgi:vitamin B12 transporter|nr:TonB-dependent receptor [Candidatus Auribacterota bacterium]
MKQTVFLLILSYVFLKPLYADQTKPSAGTQNSTPAQQMETDNDTSAGYVKSPDDIVVVATRLKTPYKKIGSSVTVIDQEYIENSKKLKVVDLLEGVPGVTVARSGAAGGEVTSVFIRGADSDHTLVIIDGIEMNDPGNPTRSFDFGQLEVTNIERIEILRGAQSTMYGSDAMGGVISITTKRGKGKPQFYYSSEAGSFETFRQEGGVSGGTDLFNYSFGMSYTDTQGHYSTSHNLGHREKDGFENLTVSGRLGLTPCENLDLFTSIRYIDSKVGIDDGTGLFGDDPNRYNYSTGFFLRSQGTLTLFDDMYEHVFGYSYIKYDRDDKDRYSLNDTPTSNYPFYQNSYFNSYKHAFDSQHNIYFPEFNVLDITVKNTFSLGIEYEQERAESGIISETRFGPYISIAPWHTLDTWSLYVQDVITLADMLTTTIGGRWDRHSKFGTEGTIRVSPVLFIEQTGSKFKFAYSTGFKSPTISELYGFGGNEALKPEKSVSWEIGFEQYLFDDRFRCGITYFQNNFTDLIWTQEVVLWTTYQNYNLEETETNGIELFAQWDVSKNFYLGMDYTYLQTKVLRATDDFSSRDVLNRTSFIRRPKNKVGIHANYSFFQDKGNLHAELMYVGRCDDFSDFSTYTRARLEGYTIFNLTGRYKVTDNIEIFGKLVNIFDEYYEQVLDYDSQRFSLFGGVKITL